MPAPRVFITHSSVDRELAEHLVDAIIGGADLQPSEVFCSSIDGLDVPNGDDFFAYIKKQLQATTLVVPLITPAYLDSIFCMWELGAIWSREIPMCPIRVDAIAPDDLPGLLRQRQVKVIGKPGLNGIASAVAKQSQRPRNFELWERRRDSFIEAAGPIVSRLARDWRSTPLAEQRARAKIGSAASLLHLALGRVRDAAFVVMKPEPFSDQAFLLTLKEATRDIAKYFAEVTGKQVRITIKQLIRPDSDVTDASGLFVEDLVRDKAPILQTRDPVADNSDFNDIIVKRHDWFLCNDIPHEIESGRYTNSHFSVGKPPAYRSTIVWPIRKIYDGPDDVLEIGLTDGQDLVAFLCVDSNETDTFTEHHVELGAGLAAALYPVLRTALYQDESMVLMDDQVLP